MTILITAAILLELEPSENLIRSLKQACIHAEIRTYVHTYVHTYIPVNTIWRAKKQKVAVRGTGGEREGIVHIQMVPDLHLQFFYFTVV